MFNVRLQRARKAAGLSLRDLGETVGVSHAAIKKYEDGTAKPSSDILIRLSRALNVRTEYFFRPTTVELEGIAYRKRSSLPKKQLGQIEHEVIDQIERRIELESLFPNPPIKAFKQVQVPSVPITVLAQVEEIADQVRKEWDLGSNPIPDLVDVLETHGVRVFMVDVDGDDKFDGLAAHVGGMPIVVVGSHWPGDRQRFTLAHELGHLMLKGKLSALIDEEMACHRFSGAFIFPQSSVKQELGDHRNAIELKELLLLKQEFGLSLMGILYRARDLGIVSPSYRENMAKLFRIKGWHKTEPGKPYPSEKAHLFEQLVFHALAEEYIGEPKAAELLKISKIQLQRERSMESMEDPSLVGAH